MNLIRILLVEDSPTDALLIESMLAGEKSFECALTRVSRLGDGLAQMVRQTFDVVLTDLGLPDSDGLATFEALHKNAPQLPVIVLTQQGDLATAMAAIQNGAQDFLPKTELSGFMLSRTIRYAIQREKLIRELHEALAKVKTLSGMLPICASCKKVRDDKGYWNQIETYVAQHSDASFSHGLCPGCSIKFLEDSGVEVSAKLREGAEKANSAAN